MKLFICIIITVCSISTSGQVQTDTFKVINQNSSFTIDASGFVLSKVLKPIDPFYHASGVIHSKIVFNYGNNVKVGLRLVSEVRNFSDSYDNRENMILWAKPSIYGKLDNIIVLDSLTVLAGDQWRIKNGQGLFLDNFEALGVTFEGYRDKFTLKATLIGMGYNYYDDLYNFTISYSNFIRAGYIYNFFDGPSINLLSIDSRLPINKNLSVYSEIGYNPGSKSKAALLGFEYNLDLNRFFLRSRMEFRHYDENIWNEERPQDYQYVYSLTALDKPINNYYLYILQGKQINIAAARIVTQLYLYKNFYISGDFEPSIGSIKYFAYKTELGYEVLKNVKFKLGIMNKFFNSLRRIYYDLDNENFGMFRLSKRPWLFAEATFKI